MQIDSLQDLSFFESATDIIFTKKLYVDICDDLISGLLLSKIVWWYLPNENDETKLRVKHEDKFWIARGRDDWYSELRIKAKRFDRARKILEEKGLIETKIFKFNGMPTIHIYLRVPELIEEINIYFKSYKAKPIKMKKRGRDTNYITFKFNGLDGKVINRVKLTQKDIDNLFTALKARLHFCRPEECDDFLKYSIQILDNWYKGKGKNHYGDDNAKIYKWVFNAAARDFYQQSNKAMNRDGYSFEE